MPYITVEGNTLEPSQKRALIEQLTATASAIMHENIGIGGKPIAEVKAAFRRAREDGGQR